MTERATTQTSTGSRTAKQNSSKSKAENLQPSKKVSSIPSAPTQLEARTDDEKYEEINRETGGQTIAEFAELLGLTLDGKVQDPSQVRDGPTSKRNRATDDVKGQADDHDPESDKGEQRASSSTLLNLVNSLNVPKEVPPEIVRLRHLLTLTVTLSKGERQPFVDAVNKLMSTSNYCFEIGSDEEEKVVAKRLWLNTTDGKDAIEFQLTSGHKRGFVNAMYKLVPYVRPYKRKS